MFDSPMEHCAVCGKMVTLAQTLPSASASMGAAWINLSLAELFQRRHVATKDPQPDKPPNS
jgi:hypothetical protein